MTYINCLKSPSPSSNLIAVLNNIDEIKAKQEIAVNITMTKQADDLRKVQETQANNIKRVQEEQRLNILKAKAQVEDSTRRK